MVGGAGDQNGPVFCCPDGAKALSSNGKAAVQKCRFWKIWAMVKLANKRVCLSLSTGQLYSIVKALSNLSK